MKKLTEIIEQLEARQSFQALTEEEKAILALAAHVKNIENKITGMESQRNGDIVDALND